MDIKERRIRGGLSVLLPGLGHVYSGFGLRGILWFAVFAAGLSFEISRRWVPVISILAGLDAFRLPGRESVGDATWRKFVFFSVGLVMFFGWFTLVAFDLLPYGTQTRMQSRIEPLVTEIKQFKKNHGSYPESLVEMITDRPMEQGRSENLQSDPWGRAFEYRRDGEGFVLRSYGKDGVPNTADDFLYHFK
jgi:hypothetical protein